MAELTRGTVGDRPWGRTLAALGLRGVTAQLTLAADGKRYEIAFAEGAIVGAMSPLASDAAARVALTGGLVSTTQVAELARRQAASPGRDEVDVIAEHLQLGAEQALRLRRRTIAQRAARTFAVERGEFVLDDRVALPSVAGTELDVRTIVYMGARQNLSEPRLAAELAQLGTWYRLKPEAFDDLPQFGFAHEERPVVDALLNGASLAELEALAGVDPRTVHAVVYALACCNACNAEHARAPTQPPVSARSTSGGTRPSSPGSNPNVARTSTPGSNPGVARTSTPRSTPGVARTSTPPGGTTPIVQRTSTPRSGATRAPTAPGTTTGATASLGRPAGLTGAPGAPGTTTGAPPGRPSPTHAPPPARPASTQAPPSRTSAPTLGPSRPSAVTAAPRAASSTAAPTRSPRSTAMPLAAVGGAPRRAGDTAQVRDVQRLVDERVKLIEQQADHYAMLGVSRAASADELRKAYFALARQLHPDRLAALGVDDSAHVAHKVFAQLNTAFAVLSDAKRRAEYDDLAARGGEAGIREEQHQAEALAARVLEAEDAYKRGELALRRDDLAAAVPALARAVELNPEEADYLAMHAWAVFCATADKKTVERQTRTALEKAVLKSPKAIQPRFLLGRVERMLGRDQVALGHFRDVLLDKPSHHEAKSEIRAIEARLHAHPPTGGGLFGRKR